MSRWIPNLYSWVGSQELLLAWLHFEATLLTMWHAQSLLGMSLRSTLSIHIGTTLHKFTDTKGFLVKKYPLCVSSLIMILSPYISPNAWWLFWGLFCNCVKMLFITSKVQIQIVREVNLPVVLYLTQENDGFYYALWLMPHPSISRPLPMNVCTFRVHWPRALFALSMQSMCGGIWERKPFCFSEGTSQ